MYSLGVTAIRLSLGALGKNAEQWICKNPGDVAKFLKPSTNQGVNPFIFA